MKHLSPLLALSLTLSACTQDSLFRVTGFQQETFSNDADILFVLDNSSSMAQESGELAVNFGTFIETLAGPDGGNASSDGLADAVDNYIEFASRRTGFIDYRIGIVTTDPADVGALRSELVEFGESDVTGRFQRAILCDTTCWTNEGISQDPGYTCGDPYDTISEQVLDCECGPDGWGIGQNCGGGTEEQSFERPIVAQLPPAGEDGRAQHGGARRDTRGIGACHRRVGRLGPLFEL